MSLPLGDFPARAGFDDTSLHGSTQIPTPTLASLAKEGVLLMNYYVMPVCTPTRSAIHTGRHPIHTGMQGGALLGQQKLGLPVGIVTLPEQLKKLGYMCYAAGKWHLGFYTREMLPTRRGYDRFFGFLTGKEDYFDHVDAEGKTVINGTTYADMTTAPYVGLDLYDNEEPARNYTGIYNTELFTQKALAMLHDHHASQPASRPWFLYLAFNAVHSANYEQPLQAPARYIQPFLKTIVCDGLAGARLQQCKDRRVFAGMLSAVDEGVRNLTHALAAVGQLESSLLIVTTDKCADAIHHNQPTEERKKGDFVNWRTAFDSFGCLTPVAVWMWCAGASASTPIILDRSGMLIDVMCHGMPIY
jgi:arylsulfatase A-like enzyme